MADTYDVVVIGAGPAGYVSAIRAAQLGLKTGCIESGSYEGGLGGTCLNWGCIPAKALLESAALAQHLQSHGAEMGVKAGKVEYDMGAAVDRSREISDRLTKGVGFLFKKNGIDHLQGTGRLLGRGQVRVEPAAEGAKIGAASPHSGAVVGKRGKTAGGKTKKSAAAGAGTDNPGGNPNGDGASGEARTVTAKNIVIATGAVMKSFPGFEIDGEKVIGSREALALRELPSRMVVVGAGYVGVEFADVFDAFGVEVTLVEALDTLVPLEDPEIGKALARAFKKRGMDVRTGTKVKELDRDASPMVLTVEGSKGEEKIETDLVLMAVGRAPVLQGIGLEDAGVNVESGFIAIDEWCRTSAEGVYAIGDVAGQPMLAHKGSHEGITAAEHIAGKAAHPVRYDNIPSVGYCHPEVASIGMSEAKAKEAGYEVKVGKFPMSASGRALTAAAPDGFVKIVADAKYGEVLGVHMIGHNVSELIAEAGIARELESTLEEITAHAHAHPSMAETVMEAAFAALGRPIHI